MSELRSGVVGSSEVESGAGFDAAAFELTCEISGFAPSGFGCDPCRADGGASLEPEGTDEGGGSLGSGRPLFSPGPFTEEPLAGAFPEGVDADDCGRTPEGAGGGTFFSLSVGS
ncbi:MAG: hypothetical protein ABI461_08860 [Polyangiaceae bacterium]